MNHTQTSVIKRQFFATGCQHVSFEGCEEIYQKYKEAAEAPGCSACAQRRARNIYGQQVVSIVKDKIYEEVFPKPSSI